MDKPSEHAQDEVVRCPTCKENVPADRHQYRPFCSERCKLVDLGRWLDGGYAIPGEPAGEEDLADDVLELEREDGEKRRH